jgi:hypothetical protein
VGKQANSIQIVVIKGPLFDEVQKKALTYLGKILVQKLNKKQSVNG